MTEVQKLPIGKQISSASSISWMVRPSISTSASRSGASTVSHSRSSRIGARRGCSRLVIRC
jgi:hypothetical protein